MSWFTKAKQQIEDIVREEVDEPRAKDELRQRRERHAAEQRAENDQ